MLLDSSSYYLRSLMESQLRVHLIGRGWVLAHSTGKARKPLISTEGVFVIDSKNS